VAFADVFSYNCYVVSVAERFENGVLCGADFQSALSMAGWKPAPRHGRLSATENMWKRELPFAEKALPMAAVTVEVPEFVLAALHSNPDELAGEVRLAAAATWYGQGKVSQEVAAQ
jgi:hypothetical protein